MSHDLEAYWAGAELAAYFLRDPAACFGTVPAATSLSVHAGREGRHSWPHADGVIDLSVAAHGTTQNYAVALEFKRTNEGLHGVLTALGQAHAYLAKGYNAAVIVVPDAYQGFDTPGAYLNNVIDQTSQSRQIAIFTYSPANPSEVSPFAGKLTLVRPIALDAPGIAVPAAALPARTETQWAHVREGSTEPDTFFKYLQAVKLLSGGEYQPHETEIPAPLLAAVNRLKPGVDPRKYLASAPGDALSDIAWRHFWFKYVLSTHVQTGWRRDTAGTYEVNYAESGILRSDGQGKKRFFDARQDSPKVKLTKELNLGTLTEVAALEELAKNFHKRAHSYREDIDSGCEHFGFIDAGGRLTNSGYRFVDACEKYGNPNAGIPRFIFLSAVLGEGGLGSFLHYAYRLSEQEFRAKPLSFTRTTTGGIEFESAPYLEWLENRLANELHVLRKVSKRGGTERKPFQAELALLRNFGIVEDFRIGVGLTINWPEFQEAMLGRY